jgi:hypothetical protein
LAWIVISSEKGTHNNVQGGRGAVVRLVICHSIGKSDDRPEGEEQQRSKSSELHVEWVRLLEVQFKWLPFKWFLPALEFIGATSNGREYIA